MKRKLQTQEILKRHEGRKALLRLAERVRKRLRRAGVVRSVRIQGTEHIQVNSHGNGWFDFDAPDVMDFFTNPEETFAFFAVISSSLGNHKIRIRVTFLKTRHISQEVLIYLLGQIHYLQTKYGRHRITGCYPKSRKIEHLLNESGFLTLLGVKKRSVAGRKTGATRFLTYKTGNRLISAAIPKIREELFGEDFKMPDSVKSEVFRALSEAMNNVGEHAYKHKNIKNSSLRGRWWMGASMSLRRNVFSLTFYDAGVGIPKTLPRNHNWDKIRQVLSLMPGIKPDDGSMIKAAVQIGRTSSGKNNRGKGLMDLHKLIDRVGYGRLSIISREGWYEYRPKKDKSGSALGFLEGTLISWELPLNVAAVQLKDIAGGDLECDDEKDIG